MRRWEFRTLDSKPPPLPHVLAPWREKNWPLNSRAALRVKTALLKRPDSCKEEKSSLSFQWNPSAPTGRLDHAECHENKLAMWGERNPGANLLGLLGFSPSVISKGICDPPHFAALFRRCCFPAGRCFDALDFFLQGSIPRE